MADSYEFTVNGKSIQLATDEYRPLLDVLREELALTGTKYGCGEGECGACSVLIDGEVVRSCITSVSEVDGQHIQTIEGLAQEGQLHPVQQAFIDRHAMQCGYCVPGQIINAVAFLDATPNPSREEIVSGMAGNICRCCNYARILDAVQAAAETMRGNGP